MHQEQGLQFRTYVPTLMELLEDADGMVRDAAKATVIELFRYVAFKRIQLLS
jgi:CLIP-associating protein 1/2